LLTHSPTSIVTVFLNIQIWIRRSNVIAASTTCGIFFSVAALYALSHQHTTSPLERVHLLCNLKRRQRKYSALHTRRAVFDLVESKELCVCVCILRLNGYYVAGDKGFLCYVMVPKETPVAPRTHHTKKEALAITYRLLYHNLFNSFFWALGAQATFL
jgi:hypothetical protein